jgi:hypothetical protein
VLQRNKRLTLLYLGFITIYLLQTLLSTADKAALAKYHINAAQLKLVGLTVALPYIAIWIISLIGYLRLKSYVAHIEHDKDGAAFKTISHGVLGLSLWLPVSTLINTASVELYTKYPSMTADLVRANNYINVAILFFSFWLISKGTANLLPIVNKSTFVTTQKAVIAYISFSALYMLVALHDPARRHPVGAMTVSTYYQPDWLIVITLLIPRLVFWFLGVQAVQNILLYRKKVRGTLYKDALNELAAGLAAVVGIIIALRCLQSVSAYIQRSRPIARVFPANSNCSRLRTDRTWCA